MKQKRQKLANLKSALVCCAASDQLNNVISHALDEFQITPVLVLTWGDWFGRFEELLQVEIEPGGCIVIKHLECMTFEQLKALLEIITNHSFLLCCNTCNLDKKIWYQLTCIRKANSLEWIQFYPLPSSSIKKKSRKRPKHETLLPFLDKLVRSSNNRVNTILFQLQNKHLLTEPGQVSNFIYETCEAPTTEDQLLHINETVNLANALEQRFGLDKNKPEHVQTLLVLLKCAGTISTAHADIRYHNWRNQRAKIPLLVSLVK